MNVLYLYSELGPYNIPVFQALVESYGAQVHVVHWDHKKLKPFVPPQIEGVDYYSRSLFDEQSILALANKIEPDLMYVSGWMDKAYFRTARQYKSQGVPVVIGFDDMWVGSLRQRLGSLLYRFYYKQFFSHAWVAGPRQFEFAKRLGFKNNEIIFDLLSGNNTCFKQALLGPLNDFQSYPKTFLYVGNFRAVKGTDILVKAYRYYKDKLGGSWGLHCVGNGELAPLIETENDIQCSGFASQQELVKLCRQSGCFILPSRHDQWGVVVHEFAAAGMPLILSEHVGAKATFFIEGYNGVSYPNDSVEELAHAMARIADMTDEQLIEMRNNSVTLAQRITPQTSAANFVSLNRKYNK